MDIDISWLKEIDLTIFLSACLIKHEGCILFTDMLIIVINFPPGHLPLVNPPPGILF